MKKGKRRVVLKIKPEAVWTEWIVPEWISEVACEIADDGRAARLYSTDPPYYDYMVLQLWYRSEEKGCGRGITSNGGIYGAD